MKQNNFKQKGKSLFAPAEFDSAITHFFEHGDSGLMLISVPTGVGKTTQAREYILNHYNENTFFYVTPLNKNVKETYEKTRKLFEEYKLEKEFDRRAIYLQSNLDMFEENIAFVKDSLDERVRELDSFKKLLRRIPTKELDSDEKQEAAELESKFRNNLRDLLTGTFNTKKPQELIDKISMSDSFKGLLKLYPSIKSKEKNIFFLSVDKLYVGNSPIVETHYDFLRSKQIEGAIIFLDEFDSTKEKLLSRMIEEATSDEIDLPQLFRDINDKIRGEAPSVNKEMLEDVPGKAQNKTSKYAFESTQSVFENRVQKYKLDRKFKYVGTNDNKYFILSDWSMPVVAEYGKPDTPNLFVTYDEKSQFNLITNEKNGLKLTSVFKPLSGAIEYFVNALKLISENEYEKRRQVLNGELVTIYDCVDSVLNNFDFKPLEANWNYLSPLVNNKLRNNKANIKKNKFDVEFYSSGFDFVSIANKAQDAHSSKIQCISLHSTPEDYLCNLAQKAHVIGLSATAEFKTVTGNYDLNYVKRKLDSLYYSIPENDQKIINQYIEKRLSNNKSEPHAVEIKTDIDDYFGLEEVFGDIDEAKHYASELKRLETLNKEDDKQDVTSVENNCRRFSKIFKAIIRFVDNKNGKVLLTLSNRNIGAGIHKINMYQSYCKKSGRDVSDIAFIYLSSKNWDNSLLEYKKAREANKKVVLFTCYQAASTGQNLQFIEKLDEFEKETDIDSIYIEYPTHQIIKNDNNLTKKQVIEAIYQIEALSEFGMILGKKRRPLIKAYLSGCYSPYQLDMYYCPSTNMHILKILCQAIGRVSRTENKQGDAFIYIDEDIVNKVDVSLLRGGTFTKEFSTFVDYIYYASRDKKVKTSEDTERINYAEQLDGKAKQMINEFLGEWGEFDSSDMQAWINLRDFVLHNPTVSSGRLNADPNYKRFYLQQPETIMIERYYYSSNNDFIDSISYTKTSDVYYEVSSDNSCLEYLNKNPIISKVFLQDNIPIIWEKNNYVILPTIYKNIYKGAIGEKCVKSILDNYGIHVSEISDPKRFERFDFIIDGKEMIGVDAKFWSLASATATSDDLSKQVEVEKILKKIAEASFEKAIIVNILCKNASKTLRKPHIKGDGKILVIPSLIDPDSQEALVDEEAIDEIISFVEETKNGK